MKNLSYLILFLLLSPCLVNGQLLSDKNEFSRKDSLRGQLTPLRTCYDVTYYHLDVDINIPKRSIAGNNLIKFKTIQDFNRIQIDLFDNMAIDKILYRGKQLKYTREFNAVFIDFPTQIKANTLDSILVYFSGTPHQANRAPWDGGFDWKKDSNNKPWVASANQGIGASLWWPNKDHQSDEPDSVLISVTVPKELMNVSNGRLRNTESIGKKKTKFNWFVSNPINNYNIAINIGDYVHFQDSFNGEKGKLDIDYYVLRENIERAKPHFEANVKPMLKAFEYWFGPYPFYEDSFKLIETSHLGMEHQSGIAYGNRFLNGYLGRDGSGTGWGLKWDFIIIHEAGHEWFGNNITASDIADMWIHESFTNYSEALYIDYYFGKKAGQEYIHGNRRAIQNKTPIQGQYHVNNEGSGDMYNKGGVLHNMIRTIIADDDKWRSILRGLNAKFYHQQVDYDDIVNFINQESGLNFNSIFEQYVKTTLIPVLCISETKDGKVQAKWKNTVENFEMPVYIGAADNNLKAINITNNDQTLNIHNLTKENIKIDTFNYYIDIQKN
ncbi:MULTISPECIES: M1 family metallopeptidase [unclassified Sphingobacterium]|uniref:M1 family metallopeptidase n=1 Tax=unclassified Sphingobacterium TaxID=2609468 RepID=UPI00104DA373|nr:MULTISPECIES: M1 family metallopeptidase [unclassified Sphingobacterium]MCS3556093.1 aminopeptidase N [Sphingobacterium sp. JUb21]TCR08469.1 peptidase M1-like protein [Sphingobacterium sp. JUb20]